MKATGVAMFVAFACLMSLVESLAFADPVSSSKLTVGQTVLAGNAFGFDLLRQLASAEQGQGGNLFVSPVSISQALGMLYVGSAGSTRAEIGNVLHVGDESTKQFDDNNAAVLETLKSHDNTVELTIANAIWSQIGRPFAASFENECRSSFSASPKSLDFTNASAAAAKINNWVNFNTKGKITEIVSPNSVRGASMVLTNAVYFKGKWIDTFDSARTAPAPFYLEDGSAIQLPTMHRSGDIEMNAAQSATVVRLPYSGDPTTSMVIILPEAGQSVDTIAKSLNAGMVSSWIDGLKLLKADLYLPKFHVGYSTDLVKTLQALGIKRAFAADADLSPTGLSNIFVSDVVHKATMDVDEQGTVAAAATAIVTKSMAIARPRIIRIDHPFICAIRSDETGALLFLGIIKHPDR